MTSEIRANTLKNRVGLGTVSFTNTGPVVSGIVTATSIEVVGAVGDNAGRIKLPDGMTGGPYTGNLELGNNRDFVMVHDAYHTYITNNTGDLYIGNSAGSYPVYIKGNNAVEIRYASSLVLQTTSSGVSFPRDIDVDGHTNLDNVSVAGVSTFASNVIISKGSDVGNIIQMTGADTTSEILEAGIVSGHVQLTASYAAGGSNTCGFIFRTRHGAGGTDEKLRIQASGNVGIGSEIPGQKLDVSGTILTRSSANTATFSYNTLQFQTSGGAHIDHGTTDQNLNFRVTKSSTADTTMVQINAASEQTKFRKIVTVGLQGGSDTTQIGGGSGIGAYLQLNYASGGIVNTKLLGNNTSWLNSHYGNVGIGTQVPNAKFVVSNAGANGFEFNPNFNSNNSIIASYNRSGGGSYTQLTLSASQHIFAQGGSEYGRFDTNGSLLINGTTSFNSAIKLQVRGASSSISDGAQIFDVASTAASNGGTRLAFGVNEDTYTWIRSYESGVGARDLVFYVNGENLRITSTGKLKLTSTTNNQRGLSVIAPKTQINFGTAEDVGGFLMSENNGQFGLSGGGYWTGSNWAATHTGSAQIRHDGGGAMVFCTNASLTSGNNFTPTERLRIDSSGRTLLNNLGNATPGLSANADDLVIGYGTQSAETGITMFSTVESGIRFNDNSGTDAAIGYNHSARQLKLNAGNATRFTVAPNASNSSVFNMGAGTSDQNNTNQGDRSSVKVGDYLHLESPTGGGHNGKAGLGYNCYFGGNENFYSATNAPSSGDNRAAAYGMGFGNHYFYGDASNTAHSPQAQLTMTTNMVIHRQGYVTKPQTPAFFATHTGASNSQIGTLVYNTSGNGYYNNGGHFDVGTGKFTAPVTGIYTFHFHGFFQVNQNNASFEAVIYRRNSNGTGAISLTRQYGYRDQVTNQYGPSISMHCTCYLTVGQTVESYVTGLSFHGSNGYYFGGHLVG